MFCQELQYIGSGLLFELRELFGGADTGVHYAEARLITYVNVRIEGEEVLDECRAAKAAGLIEGGGPP